MSMFKLAVLTASAALLAAAPSALAGDLGDGGFGPRAYGMHRPYMSGQDAYPDQYGRDREYNNYNDYSDDNANRSDNDDDDDDNWAGNDSDDSDDGSYEEHHAYRHEYRHHGSTKDDDDPRIGNRAGCIPGWRVKQRLIGEGWSNFELSTYGHGEAIIRATRSHSGREFELRLDGCTGETLSSYPLDRGPRYSQRY